MSGKPYTMKEMKSIVDYLIQNKYYNAIRGRKMWMDFAETSLTTRSWQSLKETFLKRILPDIHNPYYKLTKEQIVSFTQGWDVETRPTNKLKIQTIKDDSNEEQEIDKVVSTSADVSAQKTAGEDNNSEKINQNKSCVDTIIFENYYNSAEDIQKDLESTSPLPEKPKQKKFKDFITYSEPLSPMLQEVINDFATDTESSDREPVMEIDENPIYGKDKENHEEQDILLEEINTSIEIRKIPENVPTDSANNGVMLKQKQDSEIQPHVTSEKIPQNDVSSTIVVEDDNKKTAEQNGDNKNADDNMHVNDMDIFTPVDHNTENKDINSNQSNETQNVSNTTYSLLPNNQEALATNKIPQTRNSIEVSKMNDDNKILKAASRKRAISEDNLLLETKKKKNAKNFEGTKLALVELNTVSEIPDVNIPEVQEIADNIVNPKEDDRTAPTSEEINNLKDKNVNNNNSLQKEPQVESVSLLDEELNETKLNGSGIIDEEIIPHKKSKKETVHIQTQAGIGDIMKSHSESEINREKKTKKNNVSHATKAQRDRTLASVFGFSTGAVTKRKSKIRRGRSNSHHNKFIKVDSHSSEWTSETDEDDVSPPHGRRNKYARRYLKPKSIGVLSMEEEGGLFVMYGNRIYPIVNDSKTMKNFLVTSPGHDSENFDEGTYWKFKYEAEKKKTEDLKKLVNKTEESSKERKSFNQEPKFYGSETAENAQAEVVAPKLDKTNVNREESGVHTNKITRQDEAIKIIFTKNNEEVHLEGHWPQIHPVLEKVINIFHKDTKENDNEVISKAADPPNVKEPSKSGMSTPIIVSDPEVRNNVENIEKEIFKEIEERDKEEEIVETKTDDQEQNVTKRMPRKLRNSSTSTVSSLATRSKSNKPIGNARNIVTPEIEKSKESPGRSLQSRTPRASKRTSLNPDEYKPIIQTRKSQKLESDPVDDDNVRYMFPPENKGSKKKITRNSLKNNPTYLTTASVMASPDSLSLHSESTQGYHESDISPIQVKRKKNLSSIMRRTRSSHCNRKTTRSSQCIVIINNPSDSSNSEASQTKIHLTKYSSSGIYNSESYQNLFLNRGRSLHLERIDEMRDGLYNINMQNFTKKDEEKLQVNDAGSSSSFSLPQSPELSVVERLSVNKDLLSSVCDHPSINEIQANNDPDSRIDARYVISKADVSMPLMEQKVCEIEEHVAKETPANSSKRNNKPSISESLLNEIRSVKIYDTSDSIDRRLEELLLESNKKDKNIQRMDVGSNSSTKAKKSRVTKRCSTPRKRKNSKLCKSNQIDAIVEEHMEACSYVRRSVSSPPSLQIIDDNAMDFEDIVPKKKYRPKKDVIKVKILKPNSKRIRSDRSENNSATSNYTDSGINDIEMVVNLQNSDTSIEFLHNHSDNCDHANEFIDKSIEFIDEIERISLDSNSICSNFSTVTKLDEIINEFSIGQDFQLFNKQLNYNKNNDDENVPANTNSMDLGVNNSLITEDLSDEAPLENNTINKPSKWYLLSEDETNHTNMLYFQRNGAGSGANLKDIFPITCAVPDLSSITEASRENDDSRKPSKS